MLEIRNRSPRGLRRRARLLRLIDTIGRWSNLDPFTIMISAPTVQFGHPVHPDGGRALYAGRARARPASDVGRGGRIARLYIFQSGAAQQVAKGRQGCTPECLVIG